MRRMERDVAHGNHSPYDWIIILGGTNDLDWGQSPKAIYENLRMSNWLLHWIPRCKPLIIDASTTEKVWTVALQSKAQVLALSVIESASNKASLTRRRNELNEMIAKHEEKG